MDIKLILNIFLYLVIPLINLLIWDLYMIRILIRKKENLSNHTEVNKKK